LEEFRIKTARGLPKDFNFVFWVINIQEEPTPLDSTIYSLFHGAF